MLSRIGIILFVLGAAMGDSECLLVPIATMLIGAGLCRIGYLKGESIWLYEEDDNERDQM